MTFNVFSLLLYNLSSGGKRTDDSVKVQLISAVYVCLHSREIHLTHLIIFCMVPVVSVCNHIKKMALGSLVLTDLRTVLLHLPLLSVLKASSWLHVQQYRAMTISLPQIKCWIFSRLP